MDGTREFDDDACEGRSDCELLAAILGGGRASRALADRLLEGGLCSLRALAADSLLDDHGLRDDFAQRLIAALELGRRAVLAQPPPRPRLLHAGHLVQRLWPRLAHLRHEEFWTLLLTPRREELRAVRISSGGLSLCSVLPRESFAPALRYNAGAVAFAHNHPSGDASPSADDTRMQLVLEEAGRALGIEVIDHLVVSARGAHSARAGLLPPPASFDLPPPRPDRFNNLP